MQEMEGKNKAHTQTTGLHPRIMCKGLEESHSRVLTHAPTHFENKVRSFLRRRPALLVPVKSRSSGRDGAHHPEVRAWCLLLGVRRGVMMGCDNNHPPGTVSTRTSCPR